MTGDSPVREKVASFYDAFAGRLLSDIWFGNPRTEAAILYALRFVPVSATRILDIGFGIGWSTSEMARCRRKANVMGWDISPELVNTARQLTSENNAHFDVRRLPLAHGTQTEKYDAIVLLDVYEHFLAEDRPAIHATLRSLLDDNGVIILACPTPKHQEMLRTLNPAGLQPVDEDVTQEDIERLARDVGAQVIDYQEVTIWSAQDYFHAVVECGHKAVGAKREGPSNEPALETRNTRLPGRAVNVFGGTALGQRLLRPKLESRATRQARIRSRLNVRAVGPGLVVSASEGSSLCVATPAINQYSETFIRNHIVGLRMPVRVLHGRPLCLDDEGQNLFEPSLSQRVLNEFRRSVLKRPKEQIEVEAVAAFLRRNKIAAVLAEYGVTGAEVMHACRQTGIPLIVHFHGYDAYRKPVLESYATQYAEMFQYAAGIIAVSRDMRQQLIQLGVPTRKITWIPYGVDVTMFDRAMPAEVPPHFLAVGRFVEKKAPLLTLLAFSKVLEARPDARLTMIGDGILWGPCCHLVRALGIGEAVEFTGARDHAFVSAAMRKARAFVQHSMQAVDGDSEGTPVAVTEAQAAGLPVVATTHAGIKDVVVDGRTGLLVAEGDTDGMASAMIDLAANPQRAAELGRAGRQRVLKNFTREQSLAKLAEVIQKASGGRIPRYQEQNRQG